jgi:tetratricopeptide (TPR) repeat protein
MKQYEEALADFERAIALDGNESWFLTHRGRIYRFMERYEEALADFERAIALDEKDDCKWANKALIYLLTGQADLYRRTLHVALDIARSRLEHLTKEDEEYYTVRFSIAIYLLGDGSLEAAEVDYRHILSMCTLVSTLQGAAVDLEELLAIQPANELAQNMLTLIKTRIEEMRYTHSSI